MTEGSHKLGEVLRAAREAKGVELPRVERETKIRERYLSALERGDYRDLPGSVYTKGFLRNYGTYLGLDPEYLIDLYRIETADARSERPVAPTPPRPMSRRRSRAFVVTPGAIVAAILTMAVGGFFAYLGWELVNFAREPELRITDPAANVNDYTDDTITIRGVTEPNARVTVENLRENPTVEADADGDFEVTVELLPGSNVVWLTAFDPVTNRTSPRQERTIIVVSDVASSPSAEPAALAISEPAEGATVTSPVSISGTAAPGATVTVTPALSAPPTPSFAVTDAAGAAVSVTVTPPAAPAATTLTADEGGSFAGTLALPPGTWSLSADAGSGPVTRSIVVGPASGLAVVLRIGEGGSYLELDADGAPIEGTSGTIAANGASVSASATETIRIRAGNAGAVRVEVNGVTIGPMGTPGAVVEWRIARTGG